MGCIGMSEKKQKINLDTVVWNRVHYPLVDGKPLFRRVDGGIDTVYGMSSSVSAKWEQMTNECYNSPDNVRKVIITSEYILVEYYRPFGGTKAPLNKLLFNKMSMAKYGIDNLIQSSLADRRRVDSLVQVSGTGLGGLIKPWVCSNIEEIYFDHSILISPEVSAVCGNIIEKIGADISNTTLLDIALKVRNIPVQAVEQIFKYSCLKGVESVRDRFPRLKAVGYVDGLHGIYEAYYRDRKRVSAIDAISSNLYTDTFIHEYAKDKRASVWRLTDIPNMNDKFSIKENIYIYDNEILSKYAEGVKIEIGKYEKDNTVSKDDDKVSKDNDKISKNDGIKKYAGESRDSDKAYTSGKCSDTKSSLEESLDKITDKKKIQSFLVVILHKVSQEQRTEVYESMTRDGQKRYGEYIRAIK